MRFPWRRETMSAPRVAKARKSAAEKRSAITLGIVFSDGDTAKGGRVVPGVVATAYQWRRSGMNPMHRRSASAHSVQANRAARCALTSSPARGERLATLGDILVLHDESAACVLCSQV